LCNLIHQTRVNQDSIINKMKHFTDPKMAWTYVTYNTGET